MGGQSGLHANLLFEAVRVDPAKSERASAFRLLRAMRSLGRFGGAEPGARLSARAEFRPWADKAACTRTFYSRRSGSIQRKARGLQPFGSCARCAASAGSAARSRGLG